MSDASLIWGVKRRFVSYLSSLPDGSFSVENGASRVEGDLFRFPALAECDSDPQTAHFGGVLRLMGHGGFMHVKIANPSIERRDNGLVLTIADPFDDDPALRIPLARLSARGEGESILSAELTVDAVELFAGRYPAGEPLDPIELTTVRWEPRAGARGRRSRGP